MSTSEIHDHIHHQKGHIAEIEGCKGSPVISKCSLLHQSIENDEGSNEISKEQYDLWYHKLLKHSEMMHSNFSRGETHDKSFHHHRHSHDLDHSTNETDVHHHIHHHHHPHPETPVGSHDHVAKRDNSFAEEMEESFNDPEMIYATCQIVANRHISLILQENVGGRINLWQQKDGNGPLSTHIRLNGLRVPGMFKSRVARESNLMPVETPFTESGHYPSLNLVQRGFHVHVNGNLSRDCQSTGTHYNPTDSDHGGSMDDVRHVGDLGNIRSTDKGSIDAEYTYPKVSLVGEHSIIGRSLVVSCSLEHFHFDLVLFDLKYRSMRKLTTWGGMPTTNLVW